MLAFQLILAPQDGSAWGFSPVALRAAIRTICCVAGKELLLFHVSDTHVHVVVLATRSRAGRIVQALNLALSAALGVLIGTARVRPVNDVGHLDWLLVYILCNDEKHGVLPDPWRENSNLPDLLGARLTAAATIPKLRESLPRVKRERLLELAEWPPLKLDHTPSEAVFRAELADAAAAVFSLSQLGGKSQQEQAALTAACHAAAAAKLAPQEAAALLSISRTTYFRHLALPPQARVDRALARQLYLREVVPRREDLSYSADEARPDWKERSGRLKR